MKAAGRPELAVLAVLFLVLQSLHRLRNLCGHHSEIFVEERQ
jgi:predicted secreted protein